MKKSQSIIEMILVLGFVVLISLGLLAVYTRLPQKNSPLMKMSTVTRRE